MMSRSSLLLAIAFAIPSVAAELVAPRPVILGPTNSNDVSPVSLSSGTTTLVAWVNENNSAYAYTHQIQVRNLDDAAGTWSFTGVMPILATNGSEFIVAFSRASPYYLFPVENVGVRFVSGNGEPGVELILNRSMVGSAGGAAWNGERWVIGYTSDGRSYVALLDSRFSITTVDLGAGALRDVAMVGEHAWAFLATSGGTEAVEILASGAIGTRHSIANVAADHAVPLAEGALLFAPVETGAAAIPFDPVAGFGTPRPIAPAGAPRDAVPWAGGAAVLVTGAGASLVAVDTEGEPVGTHSLESRQALGLGEARDGPLYFEGRGGDIYGYHLQSLEVAGEPELISAINVAWQGSPLVQSNGEGAIAFWTENGGGPAYVRSRAIDATGHPFGPLASFDAIPAIHDLSFDGERFFAVWASNGSEIYGAPISRDGAIAGEPVRIGEGTAPAIASHDDATFVVWRALSGTIFCASLRKDASPLVAGGWPLLPAFADTRTAPRITASHEGFLIAWAANNGRFAGNVRIVAVSSGGTVLRGFEIPIESTAVVDLASQGTSALALLTNSLGTVLPALYTFNGEGNPFEAFGLHWPWLTPRSVTPIGADRYLVALSRNAPRYPTNVMTSEFTMFGAFITGITFPRGLGPAESVAVLGETPLGIFIDARGVWVTTGTDAGRQRAVARP